MALRAHGLDVAHGGQRVLTAEVDVGGTTEGGETERELSHADNGKRRPRGTAAHVTRRGRSGRGDQKSSAVRMWLRTHLPASFRGPSPAKEPPEHVPLLNTAPVRLSSEKFQLVQEIFASFM